MSIDSGRVVRDELSRGRSLDPIRSMVTIALCGAVYGAALSGWSGGRLILYGAIKLPLVLLVTAVITVAFNTVAAVAFGALVRLREVAAVTLSAMAVAAVLLASLAPVIVLFDLSLPRPGVGLRATHNLLYLLHTVSVGTSGLAGTALLWRALRAVSGSRRIAVKILSVWLIALASVGGEVAWALRPFVGSVFLKVAFVRPDAFDGNVYEFIWTDIRPHLFGGDVEEGKEGRR